MKVNHQNVCAVVLAAGDGKRMKADRPKVLCEVLFKPMIDWVCQSVTGVGIHNLCVIIGDKGEMVEQHMTGCGLYDDCKTQFVVQRERLGTGHAVLQAGGFLDAHGQDDVLVLCGDAPFVDADTIYESYQYHRTHRNVATVITANLDDPTGYGRIIRKNGKVHKITEQKDTDDKTAEIREVNSGAYWFKADKLAQALKALDCNNAQNEYYLTDVLLILGKQGFRVDGFVAHSEEVVLGANDRKALLKLSGIARRKIIGKWLEEGVEFISTDGVIIGNDVEIAPAVRIMPGSIVIKGSKIHSGCVIGPNAFIENAEIQSNCTVNASQVINSNVAAGSEIGPFICLQEK